MRVLKFILETSKPYRWYMYGTLFAIGIISIDANIKPYLIKLLIDTAVNPEKANLWVLITIFATSQILMILSWSLVDLAMAKYNPQHRAHMTAILTNRINHYSYTFFQNNLSGSIVAKIGDVFNLIPKIVSTITCQFVVFFLTLLITLILLAKIHILFAIGLLLWISIFLTVTIYILTKKIKVFTKDYAESRSVIFGHLSDYLTNMLNVKLFATTIFEMQKLNLVMQNFINKAQKYGYVLTKFYFVQGIIVSIYIMGFLLWLIALQNKNLVTAGDFTLIVILNFKMLDKMYEISHHIREFVTDWGSVEQAISILETAPEIQDQPNASILQINRGEIIFDQIKFYYKGTEALFQNKSVVIAPGQKVGLVGYSGGGKSTFVNLILRLYDVIDGRVLIDNQDIHL